MQQTAVITTASEFAHWLQDRLRDQTADRAEPSRGLPADIIRMLDRWTGSSPHIDLSFREGNIVILGRPACAAQFGLRVHVVIEDDQRLDFLLLLRRR